MGSLAVPSVEWNTRNFAGVVQAAHLRSFLLFSAYAVQLKVLAVLSHANHLSIC